VPKKNPDILTIVGKAFLEDAAIENVTHLPKGHGNKGKGNNVRAFRDALGINGFGLASGNGRKRPTTLVHPTMQPTIDSSIKTN